MSRKLPEILKTYWPAIFVALCAAMLGAITWMYTFTSDDLSYCKLYSGYLFKSEPFPGLQPWFDFFVRHAETVNGRFGDKFMPLYVTLPRWTMALCQTVCAILMFGLASRLAFGKGWMHKKRTAILTSLMVLVLPWFDSALLACMLINYQMTIVIALAWVFYLLYPPKVSVYSVIGISILSFCAGSWHEQSSLLAFPAVVFIQLLRERRPFMSWLAVAFYCLGIAFILLCPGFWVRLDKEFVNNTFSYKLLILTSTYSLPFVAVCVWLAIRTFILKKENNYKRNEWLFMGLASALVCGTLYVSRGWDPTVFRVWWFPLVFSLIGWFIICKRVRLPGWIRNTVLCVLTIATLVHLILCVYWQHRLKDEYDIVMDKFLSNKDGIVYYDVLVPDQIPLFTLRKPLHDIYVHYTIDLLTIMHPEGKMLYLLPEELKNIDSLPLTYVPGTDSVFWTPKGNLILKTDMDVSVNCGTLYYKNTEGKDDGTMIMAYKLKAERDSSLVYMWPYFTLWKRCKGIVEPRDIAICQ